MTLRARPSTPRKQGALLSALAPHLGTRFTWLTAPQGWAVLFPGPPPFSGHFLRGDFPEPSSNTAALSHHSHNFHLLGPPRHQGSRSGEPARLAHANSVLLHNGKRLEPTPQLTLPVLWQLLPCTQSASAVGSSCPCALIY